MALLPLEQIRDGILGDPSLFPQNLSVPRGQFLFVRLPRPTLEAASFLDDRILTPDLEGRWIGFAETERWLQGAQPSAPLHFVFHAGHVGSTLISRLLDETAGVLGLREPLPLRVLAEVFDELGAPNALLSEQNARALLAATCLLWARPYPDTQAVIVKATSSAGRLSAELLRMLSAARAIFVTLKPEPYLETLLAGQNSYIDLRGHGPERHLRLVRLGAPPPTPLHSMSLGELAALTWLTETLTQHRAQSEHGSRILRVDFDAFLLDPIAALRAICAHYALRVSEDALARSRASPVLGRYSKSPERAYTPTLRQEILADSRARNGEEIRKGLLWLENAARLSPSAAEALSA
jgi:hypothetical protein